MTELEELRRRVVNLERLLDYYRAIGALNQEGQAAINQLDSYRELVEILTDENDELRSQLDEKSRNLQ
jgi:hypothetical protein